ncbi:hypothetical protein Snoj_26300 [Streptomyces nojiriensis]|uniref:Uncharacterized protein n=1 Tax=Streptomyces nojiriensis TaxID=66374 RepID=A0ABQ3SKP7_9ACTN|nr:hypothetical protein [Streptomyces nojiriensis]QTI50294.1 hypothetical protein JYK04_08171 [Streptomyces nojiriensis]GGS29767.1 hypothetical protein GCM10010205_69900 [Streptomyces nojiriensis]GHI68712.1 hypothetical protein Snoj_26300 [Streptomyces nojiriensis]
MLHRQALCLTSYGREPDVPAWTAQTVIANYWALWLALPMPQPDAFMRVRDISGWDPVTLLRGLAGGLHLVGVFPITGSLVRSCLVPRGR